MRGLIREQRRHRLGHRGFELIELLPLQLARLHLGRDDFQHLPPDLRMIVPQQREELSNRLRVKLLSAEDAVCDTRHEIRNGPRVEIVLCSHQSHELGRVIFKVRMQISPDNSRQNLVIPRSGKIVDESVD